MMPLVNIFFRRQQREGPFGQRVSALVSEYASGYSTLPPSANSRTVQGFLDKIDILVLVMNFVLFLETHIR